MFLYLSRLVLVAAAGSTVTGTAGNDPTLGSSASTVIQNIFGDGGTDTLIGGSAADQLDGGEGNDSLTGNAGNDILDGGAGNDTLIGGLGDDTYFVDSATDVITEAASGGTDVVHSTTSYTLSTEVENLFLLGVSNINGTGNASVNKIVGNTGNNILSGGAGADSLIGGLGNDTYIIDSGDILTELSNEGIDTVQSSADYALLDHFDNLTLLGTAVSGTGNTLANTIIGNASNNILSSGTDNVIDILVGGLGNDTYFVGSTNDVVTEAASAGTDSISSTVNYTLSANVENLTLTGTAANGTGNILANTITGNASANVLNSGVDNLIDTLIGGAGNDTYIVGTTTDVITELLNEGTDLVQSSVTYSLATLTHVENITLTGASAINATGNALANIINGNSANNILDSGTDALVDTLIGGGGNDTYIIGTTTDVVTEIANAGTDTIQSSATYSLDALAHVENLTLTGTTAINGTGNASANVITGNAFANVLNSGADSFVDTLIGGAGDDTYIVGANDIVTEGVGAGTDTVSSAVTYSLAALTNVEKLILTGTAADGTGNALANTITGNASNNTLNSGTDLLTDTLIGGAGDDVYIVGTTTDVVTELLNAGLDSVLSTATYTLSANVENLTLTGAAVINGTGNDLANTIIGNAAANTLNGGAGADELAGNNGNDIYIVDNTGDVVTEFAGTGTGTDLIQSSVTYTLSANVENLTLTGAAVINGTGNALANTISGNTADNTLNGSEGADTLIGGTGNDIYIVDNASDVVTEGAGAGTDTIESSVTYSLATLTNVEKLTLTGTAANGTGNALANTITGNASANILNSGTDLLVDTLIGGDGNDTYIVGTTTDVVTEGTNEGTDLVESTVTYTLSANVENLDLKGSAVINGTGNDLANTINGNAAANILNGGAGADNLSGFNGNDIYIVDNTGDVVTELLISGTDSVQSSVTYTLSANVENLTLTGTAANGTGNGLANIITGNASANTLNSGTDNLIDTLIGGAGDDIYVVNTTTDIVTELAGTGTGTDLVESSVTYTLSANVENLTLTGASNINGTGNTLANTITGNSGNNILSGGTDTVADSLVGGDGNDTYLFSINDTITDTAGTDTISSSAVSISLASFTGIENITLTGTASINATGGTGINTIVGNGGFNILDGGDGADIINSGAGTNVIIGGTGADALTGGIGANVFSYGTTRAGYTANLTDSLLGSVDTITGFAAADKFQAVVNPTTTVFTGGAVGTLDQAGIAAVLTTTAFTSYRAATFTFGGSTYVAINDANAGFSAATDAVINIQTTTAATITAANFVLPWA